MADKPRQDQRVVINEGTVKKNLNPPPTSPRPAPPKAQVATTLCSFSDFRTKG
jgi:hypothetical protein